MSARVSATTGHEDTRARHGVVDAYTQALELRQQTAAQAPRVSTASDRRSLGQHDGWSEPEVLRGQVTMNSSGSGARAFKCRAATSPSPPLLPGPHTTSASDGAYSLAIAHATLSPARGHY